MAEMTSARLLISLPRASKRSPAREPSCRAEGLAHFGVDEGHGDGGVVAVRRGGHAKEKHRSLDRLSMRLLRNAS